MENKRTNTPSVTPLEKQIGFSRAVRVGNHISVSGTGPIGPDGETAGPGNVYTQTKRCFEIMQEAIEKLGGSMSDTIRTRIMLVDIKSWKEAARAHGEIFSEIGPACTFVEVVGFIKKDWLVEIEAECMIASK